MGYLVCNSCLGYYKLEEGESPEDFSTCNCYGELIYYNSIDDFMDQIIDEEYSNKIQENFSNKLKENQLMYSKLQIHESLKEKQLTVIKNLNHY